MGEARQRSEQHAVRTHAQPPSDKGAPAYLVCPPPTHKLTGHPCCAPPADALAGPVGTLCKMSVNRGAYKALPVLVMRASAASASASAS